MSDDDMVSQKKRVLLVALLSRPSIHEAALAAGVSISTAFRWRRQPKFKARLDSMRREQFEQGLHNIHSLTSAAVETLKRNLDCGKPAVEVAAASRIVDIGLKFAELSDVVRRLDQLEANQKERELREGAK